MGWNKRHQMNYSKHAKRFMSQYNSEIDCADLALVTLIDYAALHKLPIRLKYYSSGLAIKLQQKMPLKLNMVPEKNSFI